MPSSAEVIEDRSEEACCSCASYAVADGKGHYGNILYVRPEHYDKAVTALQV